MPRVSFQEIIHRLSAAYDVSALPSVTDPWLLVLRENVAYLADDERRDRAMRALEEEVGTDPERILAAGQDQLEAITGHGILAETFAGKLRKCGEIVLEEFDGDLRAVLNRPLAQAKKALKRFPGIGDPGAEKILLFCRAYPLPALESNGVRVLVRLGFGHEMKDYASMYRLVQQAIEPELLLDFDWLVQMHQLLRRHGQEVCRRSKPDCQRCPLRGQCAYFLAAPQGP
jgi:endonuclease-3